MVELDNPQATRILVVDDDLDLAQIVRRALIDKGYVTTVCSSGREAISAARKQLPEVVLLDFEMPGMNGQEVCRELRTFTGAYILMLTGRSDTTDKVESLQLGVDDYLTKPFEFEELLARIQSLLRRPRTVAAVSRRIGSLTVVPERNQALVSDVTIDLTRTELSLLTCLSSALGKTVTRTTLLREVWGSEWSDDDRLIDVHMHNLRRKLETAGLSKAFITTIRGVGFRLDVPDDQA